MVDHTHLYGGPVRKIKELFESGDLGEIYYVDSVRINLGRFQHDVNVVWDLAPHDLAIMDHLIGRLPESLSAIGACHADRPDGLEDVAYLNLDYGDGLLASFHLNWLSPVKVHISWSAGAGRASFTMNSHTRRRSRCTTVALRFRHSARPSVPFGSTTGLAMSGRLGSRTRSRCKR